ncbi:MAG: hypothetical protein RIE73_21195 [Coleofasciculus sp. C1-SOL-03]|uniref:hypothetical protein n=1 Tax=Coleofasciculus sp. C1-SOL-03 TaxID=3069522 RepID=UPI0032F5DF03
MARLKAEGVGAGFTDNIFSQTDNLTKPAPRREPVSSAHKFKSVGLNDRAAYSSCDAA